MKVIIDGNNLTARANFVESNLSRQDGTKTGVCYVGLRSLKKVIQKFNPEKVIVVFDKGISDWRLSLYPEYKANRRENLTEQEKKEKYEYINQVRRFRSYLDNLNVCKVQIEKTEADDIIGYIANIEKNMDKYILVSTDTDFYQLLPTGLKIYDAIKDIFIDDLYVQNKYGVKTNQYLYFKSMIGDKTDNITAVKGFGESAACSLLTTDINNLSELKERAQQFISKKKYKDFVENFHIIERNYKIMNLSNLNDCLNDDKKKIINDELNKQNELNKDIFLQLCKEDEFNLDSDWLRFFVGEIIEEKPKKENSFEDLF